ncbi:MAG: hypothetical protein JXB26_03430 [Candidatus Aminicenantes bacterium]|nr:hypothetical protein [Candidatus Aminicenantes bacterium]
MKHCKLFLLFGLIVFSAQAASAWNFSLVDYAFTTDVLEIIDEDYFQVEFFSVLSHNSGWSARVGYYRHLEDSDQVYADGKRHWELGFRWRFFFIQRAPNLFFLGIGFDNRPEDSTITPTAEAGVNLCIKPVILSVIGFAGYELHWEGSGHRWIKGIEARAGICF